MGLSRLQVVSVKGDQAEVVMAFRVVVEALRQKAEDRLGAPEVSLLIEALRRLLGLRRDAPALERVAPEEAVVPVPDALGDSSGGAGYAYKRIWLLLQPS